MDHSCQRGAAGGRGDVFAALEAAPIINSCGRGRRTSDLHLFCARKLGSVPVQFMIQLWPTCLGCAMSFREHVDRIGYVDQERMQISVVKLLITV